jgi:KDO2-lipid IV(A) lauroyltransferase
MGKLSAFVLISLGRIPFPLLYALSDLLAFLIFRVFGYRKKIIRQNLENSLPELSEPQYKAIERASARNFCDVMLENLKLLTLSKNGLRKRMHLVNPEILEKIEKDEQGIILITAHYNNWEWMGLSISTYTEQNINGVYKPLSNKSIDALMLKSRERFGTQLSPMQSFAKKVLSPTGRKSINIMLADQSPHKDKVDFFCNFLNQDTPVFLGPEKLMKAGQMKLYFMEVHRLKRGCYEMKIVPLVDADPEKKGSATLAHVKHLEQIIQAKPESWLWSHRRWKNSQKK